MRKRSKYRPKTNLQDPLNWVLAGLKPISVAHEYMTVVRIKNHDAIECVRRGEATIQKVDDLIAAFNVAEALATLGQGSDWLPEIHEAQDALRKAGERPKYLFNGPELTAVNLAMQVHDAQLDDPRTTVALMQEALGNVAKLIRTKRVERVKFESQHLNPPITKATHV